MATTNPHKVNDVVTCVHGNGSGEGVLWRVTQVDARDVWLEPIMTLTRNTVLRPKRVPYYKVDAAEPIELATTYAELGILIASIVASRGVD